MWLFLFLLCSPQDFMRRGAAAMEAYHQNRLAQQDPAQDRAPSDDDDDDEEKEEEKASEGS